MAENSFSSEQDEQDEEQLPWWPQNPPRQVQWPNAQGNNWQAPANRPIARVAPRRRSFSDRESPPGLNQDNAAPLARLPLGWRQAIVPLILPGAQVNNLSNSTFYRSATLSPRSLSERDSVMLQSNSERLQQSNSERLQQSNPELLQQSVQSVNDGQWAADNYGLINEHEAAPRARLPLGWQQAIVPLEVQFPDAQVNNLSNSTFYRSATLSPRRLSERDSVLLQSNAELLQQSNSELLQQPVQGVNDGQWAPDYYGPINEYEAGLLAQLEPGWQQIQLPNAQVNNLGGPTFSPRATSSPRRFSRRDSLRRQSKSPRLQQPVQSVQYGQRAADYYAPELYPPNYYDPLTEDDAAQAPLYPDNLLVEQPLPNPPTNDLGVPYWSSRPRLAPRQIRPLERDLSLMSPRYEPLAAYGPSYWDVPDSRFATPRRWIPSMANVPAAPRVPSTRRIVRRQPSQLIANRRANIPNQMGPSSRGIPDMAAAAPSIPVQATGGQQLAAESRRIEQSQAVRVPKQNAPQNPGGLRRVRNYPRNYPAARGGPSGVNVRGRGARRRGAGGGPVPIDQRPRWRY